MFLNDLRIGEAVKFENGIYAVAIGNGTFDVNGNIIECGKDIRVVEVSDLNKISRFGAGYEKSSTAPKTTKRKKPEKVISHYVNTENKEEADVKKYQMVERMFNNIHEKCFNKDRNMLEFKTMEDEYNYKLLENEKNKYKPVYKETSEVDDIDENVVDDKQSMKEKFPVKVIGYYNKSDTKYIETSIRHGKAMYGKDLGTYRFHASQYIRDYLEYLAQNQKLELSLPKDINNMKDICVNDIKLFSDNDLEHLDLLQTEYTYHLDLDDAKDMLSFANKKIDFCVRLILSGGLDKGERLNLVNALDDVLATMSKKRTTANDTKHIISVVEELKATLVTPAMQVSHTANNHVNPS